jgi:hypothetical protein
MGPLLESPKLGSKRGGATYTLQNVAFFWRKGTGLAGRVRGLVSVAGRGAISALAALAALAAFPLAALAGGGGAVG